MDQFTRAALIVLAQGEEALKAKAITEQALAQGLLDTNGKTPDATMGATIATNIKHQATPYFERTAPGLFVLTAAGKQAVPNTSPSPTPAAPPPLVVPHPPEQGCYHFVVSFHNQLEAALGQSEAQVQQLMESCIREAAASPNV